MTFRPLLIGIAALSPLLTPLTRAADPAPPTNPADLPPGVFDSGRARTSIANFPSRGARTDTTIPPRSPQETVASFKLMPGLEAEAVLHEPVIAQPLHISFDERGRMWVVQFIQYPYPAGLKIVDLGAQFHATYDKVPPAPPKHDRGADRISIHEDTDGDGTYDSHKVFLEGMNMATSVAHGRGGVWVLHPPYLLFYPDANRDDVPDGAPVVHLAGFGLEDTHSAANNLQWGPDGWLYGAQGSGVTAKVRRPGLDPEDGGFAFKGQAIWRYHPERRVFELHMEGGGNTFGLTMDAAGRVFCATNGSNTRGYHCVQGAFCQKNWGEHGYLTNPYTFGYFGPMKHDTPLPRFSNSTTIYDEGQWGPLADGHIIAVNALARRVDLAERIPVGSTYRTQDVAAVIETDDRWFRPVHVTTGPDGAVYVADWYDTRLTHMDPRDTWDKTRGRVYRIKHRSCPARQPKFDYAEMTNAELVELLQHRQAWHRKTALRLLADRKDLLVLQLLMPIASQPDHPHALDVFWALEASGASPASVAFFMSHKLDSGASPKGAAFFLSHKQEAVRLWAVRFLGDDENSIQSGSIMGAALLERARTEPSAQVRSQLASTARRLPAEVALPIIFALLDREEDVEDIHIPMMLWWALEHFSTSHRAQIVEAFKDPKRWSRPLVRSHALPFLAQRYAADPSPENQQTLAQLAKHAPQGDLALLRQGVAAAYEGRGIGQLSPAMEAALFSGDAASASDPVQLSLAIKRGDEAAIVNAMGFIAREEAALEADRIRLIQALADLRSAVARPVLLSVLSRSSSAPVREAALAALGRYDDKSLPDELLRLWPSLEHTIRQHALALLVSRRAWAHQFLREVAQRGTISKADVPDEIAQRARLWNDKDINAILDHYFGQPKALASAEKQRRADDIVKIVNEAGGKGNAANGRVLFEARCAACHKLHGRGGEIGPDLTPYERTNLPTMVLSIVDPSLAIREGFATALITTKDSRALVGFVSERDSNRLVLRDTAGQKTAIALSDITEERVLPASLMGEGLLEGLSDQDLRDFFAYLTSPSDPSAVAPK